MQNTEQNSDKRTRVAVIILAIFGIFVVFAWSNSFKSSLTSPFVSRGGEVNDESSPACYGADCPAAVEGNSKLIDTDADGLTDWNESTIYGTSPYLEDTDSDGLSDELEVRNGTDPNCFGNSCSVEEAMTEEVTETAENSGSETAADFGLGLEIDEMSKEDLISILGGGGDAELLRSALLSAGMDKRVLDQMDDETLMNNYYSYLENYK